MSSQQGEAKDESKCHTTRKGETQPSLAAQDTDANVENSKASPDNLVKLVTGLVWLLKIKLGNPLCFYAAAKKTVKKEIKDAPKSSIGNTNC